MADYFPRKAFASRGLSKVELDYLESLKTDGVDTTDLAALQAQVTTLNATVTSLQTSLTAAQQAAADAPLLVPLFYFNPQDVLDVTDLSLLTEGGDILFDEAGDGLLIEA